MNKPISNLSRAYKFCIAIFTLVLLSANAFSQESVSRLAGTIVFAEGGVVAVDDVGETRRLGRHTNIYVGDTVYTATESSVQLSMIDSAQIVLGESTIFEIREYAHETGNDDSVVVDLIEGSFRTITGRVSKEKYNAVVSGFSNIGIRGTEYQASIVDADRLLVGLYDGGVTLFNFGGELDLGLNADFDYAEVRSMFTAPVGLDVEPAGLDELTFIAAIPLAEEETATIADSVATPDPNANLIASTNPDLIQAGSAPGQVVDSIDNVVAIDVSAVPGTPSAPIGQSDAFASFDISRLSTPESVSDLVGTTDPTLLDGIAIDELFELAGQSTALLTDLDIPLQDISLLALVTDLLQDLPVDEQVQIINAVTDLAGQVAQQGANSVVEGLASGTADTVAAAGDLVADTVGNVDTTASDAVEGLENLIAGTAGTTPSGIVGDVVDTTLIDIVEDVVEGAVETVDTAGDTVETVVEETVETATETVETTVEETVETAAETVETVETVAETAGETVEETVEETVGGILGGLAGSSEEPEEEPAEESGGLLGGSSLFSIKQAPAVNKPARAGAWGAWNEPVPAHIAQSLTISAGDYSLDLIPTEVANLTGAYQYSNVTGFEGSGSAGNLTNVLAGFDVDFNTGVIANGMLSVAVADTQHWLLGFDGMVEQGIVDLNSLGGSVTDLTATLDSLSEIDGTLSGAFTGEHGESFVGGFELLDLHNDMNTVDGIYTVER